MSEIDNGGTAFPVSEDTAHFPGMTLRQWYAGMALQGMLANPSINIAKSDLCNSAFNFADKMIRAGKGE